ncbi:MAG TPA: hypothetical protein VGA49_01025 [Patescibacteria group bacterium]
MENDDENEEGNPNEGLFFGCLREAVITTIVAVVIAFLVYAIREKIHQNPEAVRTVPTSPRGGGSDGK